MTSRSLPIALTQDTIAITSPGNGTKHQTMIIKHPGLHQPTNQTVVVAGGGYQTRWILTRWRIPNPGGG